MKYTIQGDPVEFDRLKHPITTIQGVELAEQAYRRRLRIPDTDTVNIIVNPAPLHGDSGKHR